VPEWVDPEWLERAENGKLGPMRRVLMVKPLSQRGSGSSRSSSSGGGSSSSSNNGSRGVGLDSIAEFVEESGGAKLAVGEGTACRQGTTFSGS